MRPRYIFWICVLLLQLAKAADENCPAREIRTRGEFTETRFFAAPPARTREAVSDAMQAVGVVPYENGDRLIRGERRPTRVKPMGLPKGDEAVYSFIELGSRDRIQGTLVRVETRRPGSKPGNPHQSWSGTVLDETGCLLGLLSANGHGGAEPYPEVSTSGKREVLLPNGTPLTLLLRRFVFSTELRVNQRLVLEAASDVKVGQDVIIPRGALAVARFKGAEDAVEWGKGSKASIIFEFVSSAHGLKISIKGREEMHGADTSRWAIGLAMVYTRFNPSGREFALLAGTPFQVTVDGNQTIFLIDTRLPELAEDHFHELTDCRPECNIVPPTVRAESITLRWP